MRMHLFSIMIGFLSAVAGFFAGQIWAGLPSVPPPIAVAADTRPRVPVVTLVPDNGGIRGTVTGDVRLFYQDKPVRTGSGGVFGFATQGKGKKTNAAAPAPGGAQYVASKRGSKYYPVRSTAGQKLSPGNRVYFQTAEQAQQAGFRPGN